MLRPFETPADTPIVHPLNDALVQPDVAGLLGDLTQGSFDEIPIAAIRFGKRVAHGRVWRGSQGDLPGHRRRSEAFAAGSQPASSGRRLQARAQGAVRPEASSRGAVSRRVHHGPGSVSRDGLLRRRLAVRGASQPASEHHRGARDALDGGYRQGYGVPALQKHHTPRHQVREPPAGRQRGYQGCRLWPREAHGPTSNLLTLVGTYPYMAPELLDSQPYNSSVDVYSFGVVMWECLTRDEPFRGFSPMQIVATLLRGERPKLPAQPALPASYVSLLTQCWATEPERRPTFEVALERLLEIAHAMKAAESRG